MKNYKIIAAIAVILTVMTISVYSCKKSQITFPEVQSASKTDLVNATNTVINFDSTLNDDFDLIAEDNAITEQKGSTCRTVTYTPSRTVYPHTKTIDYGSGCTNSSGITKKGKVIITYYDPVSEAQGRYSEINYENFYVDNIHVEGNIKVNRSVNNLNQVVFKYIIHKTLTASNGDVKDWNSILDWTMIQGGNTRNVSDDVFAITGHAEGKETLGDIQTNSWQSDVDKNNVVIKPQSCNRRVKGGLIVKIKLKGSNDLNEYLDYGDGTCDSFATLTINGSAPQKVTLPLRFWPLNQ